MILVKEAKKLIDHHSQHLLPAKVKIERTHGLVLASDVYARHDIPFFRQSSVDGFALRFVDRLRGIASGR